MLKSASSLLVSGILFGWGPCFASCGPVLLSYIAGAQKNTSKNLLAYLVFSVARISVYLVLTLLIYFFGKMLIEKGLGEWSQYIYKAAGACIALVGLFLILGKWREKPCLLRQHTEKFPLTIFKKQLLQKDNLAIASLGILMGLLPCMPLLYLFSYVGLISKSWLESALYCAAFGLGTVFSPLLFLAAGFGLMQKSAFLNKPPMRKVLGSFFGAIMVFLGINLILTSR